MSFSSFLHSFLNEKCEAFYQRHGLGQAFQSMHQAYTSGNYAAMKLRSKEELIAYILSRRPATFQSIERAIGHFQKRAPSFLPRSLLDIGAGPLTASEAAASVYEASLQSIDCIESHPLFCELIQEANNTYCQRDGSFSLSLHTASMTDDLLWKRLAHNSMYDLAIASYSLGEIAPSMISSLIRNIASVSSVMMIIEPGTPRGAKTVMSAREFLIKNEGWKILAPCPHERECPMASNEAVSGSWCHETVRVERSKWHKQIKEGTLGYEDEPFSYLVAARSLQSIQDLQAPYRRVVHRPLHRSGHTHLVTCCEDGTLKNETASRKSKELYSTAKKLEWGDEIDSRLFIKEESRENYV